MRKVNSPSQFSDSYFIASFSGKNYEEAIKLAQEWSGRDGTTLVSYYEHAAHGKSILVSYKRKEEEND